MAFKNGVDDRDGALMMPAVTRVPEEFGTGERDLLERLAGGAPIGELLNDIVRLVERQAGGMLCSIVRFDREHDCIRACTAPSLPAEFAQALDGARIGPRAGSCGTAIQRREQVVVEDIATHLLWDDLRHLALSHGLRACCSSPIVSPDGEVLGSFAIYHRQPGKPGDAELRWARAAAHLAAIALLRERSEQEHRQQEMQLHQAQRMQSLATMAGGIAHDFNNILTAIGGNAELALAEAPGNPGLRTNLDEILKATTRATDLVRQITTFSRQQESYRESVDLRMVIEEALNHIRVSLPASITIETDFADDTPGVSADSAQLHQIVKNLASNAAHAMGDRGVLEIRTDRVTMDAGRSDAVPDMANGVYARVRIVDNGCGMDKQTQSRIFEPFFTTRPPGKGTGMGLSVVHGIMKNHQGGITVDSAPGEGTTFQLFFPASDAVMRKGTAVKTNRTAGHSEHILYVDDEEALVFLATRTLERLGYRVTGQTNSTKALEDFRARPAEFDAIVTDVSMSGLTGPELAREILKIRPDIPVIMTSGYLRPEDLKSAQALGIQELILKPGTIVELGQTLHRLLAAHRAGKPL